MECLNSNSMGRVALLSLATDYRAAGLRILSSVLKEKGYSVRLVFFPHSHLAKCSETDLSSLAECVRGSSMLGISLMTNFYDNAAQITQRLKADLNIPVLWGGVHPTVRPMECLQHADMVCIGEGEETIVELANAIRNGTALDGIRGLGFRNDAGEQILNLPRPPIKDLNSVPFPDYSLDNHFLLANGNLCRFDRELLRTTLAGVYEVFTTRGCPFGCTYCCNNVFNKLHPDSKTIRKRSIDNIINELAAIKDSWPVLKEISINDDAFFVRTESEIEEFSKMYKKRVGLPFNIWGAHPTTLTEGKLTHLAEAGLSFLRMGIQTGSENTKALFKRHYSNACVVKAAQTINKFRDRLSTPLYDIIIGNPFEKESDLAETLMLLAHLPVPYQLTLYKLALFPGTELFERAKAEGFISDDRRCYTQTILDDHEDSYMLRLFRLVNDYASCGKQITPGTMRILTSQLAQKLGVSFFIYKWLRSRRLQQRTQGAN